MNTQATEAKTAPAPAPAQAAADGRAYVFVVTRPGQVANCLEYIAQTGCKDNHLFVISTHVDATLRSNILARAEGGLFADVTMAIIPNKPVDQVGFARRVKTYKAMRDGIRELLGKLDGRAVVLHLHHANTYYPFLQRIFEEEGAPPVKTVMIEEGLETYKWANAPYDLDVYGYHKNGYRYGLKPSTAIASQALHVARATGDMAVSAAKALRAVAGLGGVVVSCVTHKDVNRLLITKKDKLLPKRYRFGIVEHFDEGWFHYPEKMSASEQVRIDELHQLQKDVEGLSPEIAALLEGKPRVMFANQKYGEYDVYFECVFSILEEMGINEVLLKVHPREDRGEFIPALEKAGSRHPGLVVVDAEELDSVPLESLLASGHFDEMVGLTTTGLFYAALVAPDVKTTSIARRFLEMYPTAYEQEYRCVMPPKHLKQFERDLQVLEAVADDLAQHGVRHD